MSKFYPIAWLIRLAIFPFWYPLAILYLYNNPSPFGKAFAEEHKEFLKWYFNIKTKQIGIFE